MNLLKGSESGFVLKDELRAVRDIESLLLTELRILIREQYIGI